MASLSRTLSRIKQDLEPHLPESSILAACAQAGHQWRERKLEQEKGTFIISVDSSSVGLWIAA